MTQPRKTEAMRRLRIALEKISGLKNLKNGSSEFDKWRRNTRIAIENVFGVESAHVKEFTDMHFSLPVIRSSTSDWEFQEYYVGALDRAIALLESMIEEIHEYWKDEEQESTTHIVENRSTNTNEIFIIHGRDNETKETVARFLEHLDLKPIILHEQSNQGRTIIEKFEQHAQVRFAVVLLTPDDVGALQEEDAKNLKARARQNVIFEFGYFIGRLGRNRVGALTKGNVEIPSDYAGVVYIPLDDAEGWKMKLVKELKDAGIDADANRAL